MMVSTFLIFLRISGLDPRLLRGPDPADLRHDDGGTGGFPLRRRGGRLRRCSSLGRCCHGRTLTPMELEQGVSAALGITIDPDREVVVLVVLGTELHQVAVPMTPEVAIAYSRAMREMAREAQTLQDELEGLSTEELQDRLVAIQKRYAAQAN